MEPVTYVVRKGTQVWVGKGSIVSTPHKLISHTMKQDMMFPYPGDPACWGPKVIALVKDFDSLPENRVKTFKEVVLVWPDGEETTLYAFLRNGFDVFNTGNRDYPLLLVDNLLPEVASDEPLIEEAEDLEWEESDLGDNLKVYRKTRRGKAPRRKA